MVWRQTAYKKMCWIIGITAVVYLGTKYILPLVVPFLIALVIVLMLNPVVRFAQRKLRLGKGTAALIVVILLFAALFAGLWYLLSVLKEECQTLVRTWPVLQERAVGCLELCCCKVEDMFGINAEGLQRGILSNMETFMGGMEQNILPNIIKEWPAYIFGLIKGIGILVIVAVSIVLLAKDFDGIWEMVSKWSFYEKVRRVTGKLTHACGTFLRAQLIIMGITAAICVLCLMLLGNPYALLVGILIGLVDALPFLGTGSVFIPWAIVCLMTGNYYHAAVYVSIYALTALIREYLEPKLIGEHLGIYPIFVIMTVYIGVQIYGIGGIVLGPLSAFLILEIYREICPNNY